MSRMNVIDIYANPDVKIQNQKGTKRRTLKMILEGKAVDNSVANALRRTILMYIPAYGYHRKNIHIENKKSKHMYKTI